MYLKASTYQPVHAAVHNVGSVFPTAAVLIYIKGKHRQHTQNPDDESHITKDHRLFLQQTMT